MSEIDWNAELRKVSREFDGLPPEPTPEEIRARRAAELATKQRNDEAAAVAGVWIRLFLVSSLAAALNTVKGFQTGLTVPLSFQAGNTHDPNRCFTHTSHEGGPWHTTSGWICS